MPIKLVVVASLLCGCDKIIGLGPRPPDAVLDGSPLVDTDGDGFTDDLDNCIDIENVDQHDEDRDNVGDVCDNCPHIANNSQENADQDNLGDACDDGPAIDCIRRFEPFTTLPSDHPVGTWTLDGDAAFQSSTTVQNALLVVDSTPRDDPWLVTRARVKALGVSSDFNNLSMWGEASSAQTSGNPDTGFVGELMRATNPAVGPFAGIHVSQRTGVPMNDQIVPFTPQVTMSATSIGTLELDMRSGNSVRTIANLDGNELVVTSPGISLPAGGVALRAYNLAVAFDYVLVIQRQASGACPPRN